MATSADIRTDVPATGNATTLSVRENFAEVKGAVQSAETALDLKARRAGDLGGTVTSSTVIQLQGRPMANTAPTPGQVLTWSGTQWSPQTAGAGLPESVVFRPMTPDLRNWIPIGTEGVFFCHIKGSDNIQNAPQMPPDWRAYIIAFSEAGGYIHMEAQVTNQGTPTAGGFAWDRVIQNRTDYANNPGVFYWSGWYSHRDWMGDPVRPGWHVVRTSQEMAYIPGSLEGYWSQAPGLKSGSYIWLDNQPRRYLVQYFQQMDNITFAPYQMNPPNWSPPDYSLVGWVPPPQMRVMMWHQDAVTHRLTAWWGGSWWEDPINMQQIPDSITGQNDTFFARRNDGGVETLRVPIRTWMMVPTNIPILPPPR